MNFWEKRWLKLKANKNKKPQIRQAKLKEQYHLEDQDQVVIVEKDTTVKLILNTVGFLVRLTAVIILVCLAFCGLVALVYPEPRKELLSVLAGGAGAILDMIQ